MRIIHLLVTHTSASGRREGSIESVLRTLAGKAMPVSGLDCLICALPRQQPPARAKRRDPSSSRPCHRVEQGPSNRFIPHLIHSGRNLKRLGRHLSRLSHCPALEGWGAVERARVLDGALRVQGSGFRVQGSGFRVQGAGFRAQGSGLRF